MYVYLSEDEKFNDFSVEPFWEKKGLVYGDWTSGPNGDGTYEYSGQIPASIVRFLNIFI